MNLDLSLVIPAYNEAERLGDGYDRLASALDALDGARVELIVVDDGSSDGTLTRAREVYGHLEHARFVQQPTNFGKGAALRLGLALANGEAVVTMDADVAIDPSYLGQFVEALASHAFVPGSRARNGRIRYDERHRTLAGAAFNRLVRYYTAITARDTQCGCKGFQRGPGRLLGLLSTLDGFAFDVELFYLADRLGLEVAPLEVTWRDVAGSSVHPAREAWRMLRDVRNLTRHQYRNPVVELASAPTRDDANIAARAARCVGAVLAHSSSNTLFVVGRDDALAAASVADALGGTLRTAGLDELARRRYEAV